MGSEYTVLAPFWFQIGSEQPTHAAGTFLGWSTDPKATAAQAAPGQYVTASGNTTLYAVWDYESFTLTVDGVSKDVDFGTELSVAAPAPTRPGYKFTGWTATTADGTVIETPETMPAHDLTLVANWVETYTLTFVDGEGNEIFTGEYVAGNATSK
jgi:uncharacterized repeat protein (TIGR02543 family)